MRKLRKSFQGFALLSHMGMGLRSAGALLLQYVEKERNETKTEPQKDVTFEK